MTAPKVASVEKAKQYVIPPVMEQLRGLPNSSVVVRNGLSSAWRRVGGYKSMRRDASMQKGSVR
jgi:hypothetical protein